MKEITIKTEQLICSHCNYDNYRGYIIYLDCEDHSIGRMKCCSCNKDFKVENFLYSEYKTSKITQKDKNNYKIFKDYKIINEAGNFTTSLINFFLKEKDHVSRCD